MDAWQPFLQQQGAHYQGGELVHFAETSADYPQLLASHTLLFALDQLGILSIQNGALADGAKKMLQGQLTCDVDTLTQQQSTFGAHCTPKGRAIANFQILQNSDDNIELIMPGQQLAVTSNSLGKFAPFFKATISTGQRRVLGLAGTNAAALCKSALGAVPDTPQQCIHNQGSSAIQLSDNRYLLLIEEQQLENIWTQLSAEAKPVGSELWTLLDIRDGIGQITSATNEEFIPQMLNMQVSHGKNGAINFKKGCYTGQEVVARMHYLGKTKRRMYRLHASSPNAEKLHSGQQCYLDDSTQSQGTLVSAARCDEQTMELLAVLTDKAASNPQLLIGDSADTVQLFSIEQLPLPYSLEI